MNKYYFTFSRDMIPHPNYAKANADGWVTIVAADYSLARKKSEEVFGLRNGLLMFSFQYEAIPKAEFFPVGELECIFAVEPVAKSHEVLLTVEPGIYEGIMSGSSVKLIEPDTVHPYMFEVDAAVKGLNCDVIIVVDDRRNAYITK